MYTENRGLLSVAQKVLCHYGDLSYMGNNRVRN